MFARNLAYCIQHRAPFIGDVQGITPAVVAILPPFNQSACLHVIHESRRFRSSQPRTGRRNPTSEGGTADWSSSWKLADC